MNSILQQAMLTSGSGRRDDTLSNARRVYAEAAGQSPSRSYTSVDALVGKAFADRDTQSGAPEIVRFVLEEVLLDQVAPPVIRPMVFALTDGQIGDIVDQSEQVGGVDESDLASICGSSATFVTKPHGTPDVEGGWREHRYRWSAVIRVVDPDIGTSTLEIYSGYTDNDPRPNKDGLFDPGTQFHINLVNILTEYGSSNMLSQATTTVASMYHNTLLQPQRGSERDTLIVRPTDLLGSVAQRCLIEEAEAEGHSASGASATLDIVTAVPTGTVCSPAASLAELTRSILNASQAGGGGGFEGTPAARAAKVTQLGLYKRSVKSHPFVRALSEHRDQSSGASRSTYIGHDNGYFTGRELMSYDRNLITAHSTRYVCRRWENEYVPDHNRNDGENIEAVLATRVYHLLAAQMSLLQLSDVSLTISNARARMRYSDGNLVDVTVVDSEFNVNKRAMGDALATNLELELSRVLPSGTVITVEANRWNVHVAVEIRGEVPHSAVFSRDMDNLYSSVISRDQRHVSTMEASATYLQAALESTNRGTVSYGDRYY